jgi:hypothetical protein
LELQRFRIQLSRAAYARGISTLSADLAQLDQSRGRMLAARLSVSIVTLLIVAIVFPGSISGLLLACLLFWLGELVVQATCRTQVFGTSFEPSVHAETTVIFEDSGIREKSATRTRQWDWDALQRIHVSTEELVIQLVGWDMVLLPTSLWSSLDARAAFIAVLQARRPQSEIHQASAPPSETESRHKLTEPMVLARVALAVGAYQLIFENALRLGDVANLSHLLAVLGCGALGGGATWLLSGWMLQAIAKRSATTALYTSWSLLVFLLTGFVIWFISAS